MYILIAMVTIDAFSGGFGRAEGADDRIIPFFRARIKEAKQLFHLLDAACAGWQLEQLKTDYIDYGFIHCIDEISDWEDYQKGGALDYLMHRKF